jgi:Leucine-rich repeat (LRR) protein
MLSFFGTAQIVNIPDANFKYRLLNYTPVIDTNSDGEIQTTEALQVTTLVIFGTQINDLTGIESFSNLTSLTAQYLPITSINVTNLTNLQSLNCSNNSNLTSLNITGLSNLQSLNLSGSTLITTLDLTAFSNLHDLNCSGLYYLTSLNISNLVNLQTVNINSCRDLTSLNYSGANMQSLSCSGCILITSLNLNSLTNLQSLDCRGCDLTSLNVSNLPNLQTLNCSYNGNVTPFGGVGITSLNVSGSNAITTLICDHNPLTALNISNLTNLTYLVCANNMLTTLNITNFNNLVFLNCSNNFLTTLNVTNNIQLTELNCRNNQLNALSVPTLLNLTKLDCSSNQIATLDVAPLLLLTELSCKNNQISNLNLTLLTQLIILNVSNNPLNTLGVSTLINLQELWCFSCQLTSIDITNSTNLKRLTCGNNQITAIDVSHQPLLTYFECGNTAITEIDLTHIVTTIMSGSYYFYFSYNPNLTFINLKNGGNYNISSPQFAAGDCPNLHFICADEQNLNTLRNSLIQNSGGPFGTIDINTISFNSYCSFTPGGIYNTITGTVTLDINNNGCDSNDYHPNDLKVTLNDGINSGTTFSNNGNFTFFTQTGNFTLTPQFQNPYFTVSPLNATLNFPTLDGSTQTQNFCITPLGIHNDLEITLIPSESARPGYDTHYLLVYKNKGNQTLSGTVNLNFNDAVLDFVSATPTLDSQTANNLNWNYANLIPFESRTIYFTLNVNGPTETPAVNIGDILNYVATINPITGDETPSDNTFNLNQTVVGSFDPNDKTCLEGNSILPEKIGDYLHYLIRFQNSGTAPAENIVVKDIIDDTKFDVASLQLTASSHPQVTRITGNKVEFIFENINLPAEQDNEPASHGFIAFKIKTKNTLVLGNTVSNTANIYFDYNFPITTNTTSTTVTALNTNEFENTSVAISPNPTKNYVHISSKDVINSVQLFDVQGRLIETQLKDNETVTFDLSDKNSGIYFLKVSTENGVKVEKVIKD